MESTFDVSINIDIDYEIGSPPSGDFDPYLIAEPGVFGCDASWQTREGPDEGDITTATTAVYPNFTNATRRSVFCIASLNTAAQTYVTWNGTNFPVGMLWLTTDNGWSAAGQPIIAAGEGSWFACEGELPDDFRVQRPGSNQKLSL